MGKVWTKVSGYDDTAADWLMVVVLIGIISMGIGLTIILMGIST